MLTADQNFSVSSALVVEDGQVELAEARGVGEDVDFDDLSPATRPTGTADKSEVLNGSPVQSRPPPELLLVTKFLQHLSEFLVELGRLLQHREMADAFHDDRLEVGVFLVDVDWPSGWRT